MNFFDIEKKVTKIAIFWLNGKIYNTKTDNGKKRD